MKPFTLLFCIGIIIDVYGQETGPATCMDATELTVNTTCSNTYFTNEEDGSIDPGEQASCTSGYLNNRQDIWYYFIGTGDSVSIALSPGLSNNRAAVLAIWGNCAFTEEIECLRVPVNTTGTIKIPTELGADYYIQVQRRSGTSTINMRGNICVYGTIPPPANDDACDAGPLPVNTDCEFTPATNIGATTSAPAGADCGTPSTDVWYSFVVPPSGDFEIWTYEGSLTDGVMALYSGTCGSLTELMCNDDYSGLMPYLAGSGYTPGDTLWVRFWGYSGETGTFDICVSEVNIPGDDPCSASPLTVGSGSCDISIWDNTGATASAPSGDVCSSTPSTDVWYSFVVPSSGDFEIWTYEGSLTDGVMALYSGTCGSLTELMCNDDYSGFMPYLAGSGYTPGDTLWVRFWGYEGATGTYGICIMEINIPGDDPCSASPLTVGSGSCDISIWDNTGATATAGVADPGCADLYSGADIWYSLIVPASGNIGINTIEGTLTDGAIAVYTGTCAGTLTEIACEEDEDFAGGYYMPNIYIDSSDHGLNPGDTLWVRFWGYGGATGTYGICAQEIPYPSVNQDCDNTQQLCASTDLADNNFGSGTADLDLSNRGCLLGNEHQSAWYGVQFETAGTFTFSIDPVMASDFDFAVWEMTPFLVDSVGYFTCPPGEEPIRCSWFQGQGATGLNGTATDNSETDVCSSCDGWVAALDVEAGPAYFILVDNYTSNFAGFNLTFGGTATINCFVLPITLLSFTGEAADHVNRLQWSTASEQNNDFFEIQKSENGIDFITCGIVDGAGNSSLANHYAFIDSLPFREKTYYRLRMTDFNGNRELSHTIVIANAADAYFNVFPNPSPDGSIHVTFSGNGQSEVVISVYTANGQEIIRDHVQNPDHFNERLYQLPAKGVYAVLISGGAMQAVKKIIY